MIVLLPLQGKSSDCISDGPQEFNVAVNMSDKYRLRADKEYS
jgi:hypothetical protein